MNLNNINKLPQAASVSDTDAFPISDNPTPSEAEKLRKVTAAQIKTYIGSQPTGGLTENFRYEENASGLGMQMLFYPTERSDGFNYQHVEFNFDRSGTSNPDFVFMKLGSRLWYCDVDVIGDEAGIVVGSNGHPGLADARGWTNSFSFTATKSDLNPATATAAQCAERINALINALTRLGTSEGHGLLRA